MAIETNLNQSPYFDDFNENKNFHRVLFRPGYAVQARELTQLQTVLQNQIERFANQVLVDGTIVTGGGLITDKTNYVKLRDKDANNRVLQLSDLFQDTDLTKIANVTITGTSTGMTGKLVWATTGSEANAPDYFTIYCHYTNAGANNTVRAFANNEILVFRHSGNNDFVVAANTIVDGATGQGLKANINDGIVYHKGNFIRLPAQSTIVGKYTTTPNAYIGITTVESTIDSNDDQSLLDNATGATNYTAPGADRLKLYPRLDTKPYGYANTASFFRIATVEGGSIVQRNNNNIYGNIGKFVADRMYDQSGNFVIDPFNIRIREHLNKTNSLGRYTLAQGGDYLDLVAEIEKGSGYVNGDKITLQASRFLNFDKATDYEVSDALVVGQQFGNYVNAKEVVGTWDFQGLRQVSLRSTRQHGISGKNLGAQQVSGTEIGTARVRGFQWDSGTPGTASGRFRIYLFDVQMNSGYSFADVRGLYIDNASGPKSMADIILETNGSAKLQEPGLNTLVFPTGLTACKTLKDSLGSNDTQFVYRTEKTVNFSTSGTATVTANTAHAGGTESMNETGSPLTNTEERNILVVAKETISTQPHTGTITGTSGNTVTGSGTTFSTSYQVGDFITIGANNPERITEITNNTSLKVANTYAGSQTGAHKTTFPTGYIFDLSSNGSITSTSSTHTINLQQANLATTFTASVYFNRLRSSATQTMKTVNEDKFVHINTGSHSAGKNGPWALGVSDVYKIVAVYKGSNTSVTDSSTDVTTHFELDDGQKDAFYDTAYLKKKSTSSLDLTNCGLLVKINYFGRDRSAGIGYLSVDSYPIDDQNTANTTAITTQEIPLFTSPTTGVRRDLRDSIDFRPIKSKTITPSANAVAVQTPSITNPTASSSFDIDSDGAHMPTPDENFQCDVQYYLPRKDRIMITQGGNFQIIKGVADRNPKSPPALAGGMTLGILNIPPYPSLSPYVANFYNRTDYQVTLDMENNRRYTMKDLRALEQRIKSLEYYSTMNLLETTALNKQVFSETTGTDRYKNGFFVDNFSSHLNSDASNPYYRAAIDVNLGQMRPTYKKNFISMSKDLVQSSTNMTKTGDLITLSYTHTEFNKQPYASKMRNPVQELLFNWRGHVDLDPSQDNTPDITTLPEVQIDFDGMYDVMLQTLRAQGIDPNGTTWGDWNITSTGANDRAKARRVFVENGQALGRGAVRERTITTTSLSAVTETVSLGTSIESISLREFMRSRVIRFTGWRMKPNSRVWAYFDDEAVSAYCRQMNSSWNVVRGWGGKLVTDSTGTIYGEFRIPNDNNLKFRSGTKRFVLQDISDPSTEQALISTSAHGDYTSQAFDIVQRGTTMNIKTPQFSQQTRIQRQRLGTVSDGDRAWWDPLAQSFTVNVSGSNDGVYVTKIDLFFGKKDSNLPLTLQIREMENGFPTETIVPNGIKTLQPASINISATGATPTTFTFDTPVFLKNNTDYCMVAVPAGNSDQYALWVAKLGEEDASLPNTIINKQTAAGVLFSSSNDKTWNPIQDEDMKYTIHVAQFTTSTGTVYLENDPQDYFTIDELDGTFNIGESVVAESVITFANNQTVSVGNILQSRAVRDGANTNSTYYANGVIREIVSSGSGSVTVKIDPYGTFSTSSSANGHNLYLPNGTWVGNTTSFSANTAQGTVSFYYGLAGRMHLTDSSGAFANGYVRGQSTGASARVTSVDDLTMNAIVPKIPQITYSKTSAAWSARTTSATGISSTYAAVELGVDNNFYDSEKSIKSVSNESSLSPVNGSTKSLTLKGTFSTTDPYVSPVVDVSRANIMVLENVINNSYTDEHKTYGDAEVRYISKQVTLADGQDAEDMVVYMNAFKPVGTDIKVYARLINGEDPESFDTKDFTPLTQFTAANTYSAGLDGVDIREYEFGFSANTNGQGFLTSANNHARLNSSNNDIVAYRGNDGSIYHTYKTFAIKIVMTSTGTNLIPLVDDIRVIALQK